VHAVRRYRYLLAVAVLATAQAVAQTPSQLRAADPGATQQRQMDEERRRWEDEREQLKPITEPLKRESVEAPAVQAGPDAVRFMVREVRFTASEILSTEELDVIAREFQGRELNLADLRQLAARVNALYRSKGVVTAQAVVPPQDVSSGIVLIKLVEGRLGRVRIEGNDSTRESYVVDRLRLQPGDLMDLERLEAALVRFNRTNDAQLQTELKPGEQFATTDLRVAMIEPPRQDLRLILDNFGASSTGTFRTGIAYLNRSLLGFRDNLSLSYTKALGQESQAMSYGFPVNTWGGRLNLGYYKDNTAIKNGDLSSLNITGESIASVVSFRQPTFVDSSAQIDVVVGGKERRNSNWIDNVLLVRTDTADSNLGLEAQLFGQQSNWFASYVRSFGHADVTATERQGFVIDRGNVRYNRDFSYGLSFRGNLSWQSSNKVLLPSSEQFFIGGDGSVRGYPVGVYSGDTGQLLNLELHHPLLVASAATHDAGATGFFFVDYGRVKSNSSLDDDACQDLTGVGWGMHANLGKHAYARLVFGYGIDKVPQQPRSYAITLQLIGSAF